MADNPLKYESFLQPDSSILEAIAQLEALQKQYVEVLKTVKAEATNAKQGLSALSGVTDEQREALKLAAAEAEKLSKAQKELTAAESENAKKLEALKKARTEVNKINKLTVQLNENAEGSYNKLSAQYALNRIALDKMSKAERESTDAGKKLETETAAIYEEMTRLQRATGASTLSVGKYENATKSLRTELRANTQALAEMAMRGEENTQAYRDLLRVTGEMRDTMGDTQNAINAMASDTSNLDAILGGAAAAGGGFSVAVGAMEMFGGASEDVAEAQRKLQSVIAISTGIQEIQVAVQKDGALMMGISRFQSYALSKAEAYRRLITIQGTSATVGATVAQRVFNMVASVNPYVILATALVTVVGALVLFSSGTASATEKQNALNASLSAHLAMLEREKAKIRELGEDREKAASNELALVKARGGSTAEQQRAEDKLFAAKRVNNAALKGFFAEEITQLDANKKKLEGYRAELERVEALKASGKKKILFDVDLNGKMTKAKVDDAITTLQATIDNYDKKVNLALDIKSGAEELDQQAKVLAAERAKAAADRAKEMAKVEIETTRAAEDAKLKTLKESWEKQSTEIQLNYTRQVQDLQFKLNTENNLTQKARIAINQTIISLNTQMTNELIALDKTLTDKANENALTRLNTERVGIELRLAAVEQGSEAEGNLKLQLLQKQREIELKENSNKTADLRQSDVDINAKYNALVLKESSDFEKDRALKMFDLQQALSASEFDLLKKTEAEKTRFKLQAEKERLEKILKLNESSGIKMSDVEVQTIKNTIAKISKDIDASKKTVPQDIYEVFGINLPDEKKQAISESTQFAIEQLNAFMQSKVDAANTAVQATEKEVNSSQSRLDAEIEARNAGYANDVAGAQKSLALAKKTQNDALKEQQRAQKAQALIQSIQQAGNLITASAMIWGQLGFPWAIPALAVMWGSFALSKVKAAQVTKQQSYGEGTVELLEGGSHQSGNDVDLNEKIDRRAEGGEFFAVINKRNSRKYRSIIPGVVNSLNNGTFDKKYMNAYDSNGITVNVNNQTSDLKSMQNDVSEIRKANERKLLVNSKGQTVEIYKNLKRTFK